MGQIFVSGTKLILSHSIAGESELLMKIQAFCSSRKIGIEGTQLIVCCWVSRLALLLNQAESIIVHCMT